MHLLKITVLLSILCLFNCNSDDKIKIPKAVKKTFKAKYPNQTILSWEIDKNGDYEARFKEDGAKYRVDISPKGNWVETETNIELEDLPKAIQAVIEAKYSDEKLSEIEKVDSASKGQFYDVEFKRKGKNKDVEFREDGTIIK